MQKHGDYCLIDKWRKSSTWFCSGRYENGKVVQQLLIDLGSRGLKHDQGMLVVVDGSKGLSSGVRLYFGPNTL